MDFTATWNSLKLVKKQFQTTGRFAARQLWPWFQGITKGACVALTDHVGTGALARRGRPEDGKPLPVAGPFAKIYLQF